MTSLFEIYLTLEVINLDLAHVPDKALIYGSTRGWPCSRGTIMCYYVYMYFFCPIISATFRILFRGSTVDDDL